MVSTKFGTLPEICSANAIVASLPDTTITPRFKSATDTCVFKSKNIFDESGKLRPHALSSMVTISVL